MTLNLEWSERWPNPTRFRPNRESRPDPATPIRRPFPDFASAAIPECLGRARPGFSSRDNRWAAKFEPTPRWSWPGPFEGRRGLCCWGQGRFGGWSKAPTRKKVIKLLITLFNVRLRSEKEIVGIRKWAFDFACLLSSCSSFVLNYTRCIKESHATKSCSQDTILRFGAVTFSKRVVCRSFMFKNLSKLKSGKECDGFVTLVNGADFRRDDHCFIGF